MTAQVYFGFNPIRLGYVLLFGVTALVCLGAVTRARTRIEDEDTRWGLVTLLAASGLWAGFHVGRLASPLPELKLVFYVLGLTAGLASVGTWLYFCSAYAGKSYHRRPRYRWLALGVYLAVLSVKFTSPIHGLYFSTSIVTDPFIHLSIRLGILHWIVTGLAYALSAVGFYMLFDLFEDSNYATTRLTALAGLAALPVVLDLIGYVSPGIVIRLNYEPIGVGLFALGVLYVADGSFLAVRRFGREQLVDELDEGIVLLDDKEVVRDANAAATDLFPGLADAFGRPIGEAAPGIATYLPVEGPRVVEVEHEGAAGYWLLTAPALEAGRTTFGQALVFTDITEVERQRREIDRQRDRIDSFAAATAHELRNTLNIVQGHLDLAAERVDPPGDGSVEDNIATAQESVDRTMRIVSDLSTLARLGDVVEGTGPVDLGAVAERAWESVATDDHRLDVDGGTIEADRKRLKRLLENLFVFAIENGATRVELERTAEGIVVTDDGTPIEAVDGDRAFQYGEPVPDAKSGMLLPIVKTLAEAHGWEVRLDADYRDGVRVHIGT